MSGAPKSPRSASTSRVSEMKVTRHAPEAPTRSVGSSTSDENVSGKKKRSLDAGGRGDRRAEGFKQELVKTQKEIDEEKRKTTDLKQSIDEVAKKNNEELQKLRADLEMLKLEVGIDAGDASTTGASSGNSSTTPSSATASTSGSIDENRPSMDATAPAAPEAATGATASMSFGDDILSIGKSPMRRSKDDMDIEAFRKARKKASGEKFDIPPPLASRPSSLQKEITSGDSSSTASTSDTVTSHTRVTHSGHSKIRRSQRPRKRKSEAEGYSSQEDSPLDSDADDTVSSGGHQHSKVVVETNIDLASLINGSVAAVDAGAKFNPKHQSMRAKFGRSESAKPDRGHVNRSQTKNIGIGGSLGPNSDSTSDEDDPLPPAPADYKSNISDPNRRKTVDSTDVASIRRKAKRAATKGADSGLMTNARSLPDVSPQERPEGSVPHDKPASLDRAMTTQISRQTRADTIAIYPGATLPNVEVKKRMIIQRDQSGAAVVRGGTIGELIRQLVGKTPPDFDREKFTQTFLLTFHSFLTPTELFDRLMDYYNRSAEDSGQAKRVLSFIALWLEDRNQDFFTGEDEISMPLSHFIEDNLSKDDPEAAAALREKVELSRQSFRKRVRRHIEKTPTGLGLTSTMFVGIRELVHYKHMQLALELTAMVSDLYQRIEPLEFLQKQKPDTPSRIGDMIQKFNTISGWIQTEIIKQDKIEKRWKVLKHAMKLALDCNELQNYDTAMAVISGLQSAGVFRLRQTWARLVEENPKLVQKYHSLKALLSAEENSKAYRNLIAQVTPPAIPYIGIFLKDIVFISDGNPNDLEADFGRKDFINFDKRQKLANVLLEVRRFQMTPYNIKRDQHISKYLETLTTMTEEQLYAASLVVEPRLPKK